MEKILNFFKNKAIGYYLAAANIVLAVVLTIVFFATYKGAMANNAAALVPETIGIFLIAGVVIEAVVLVLPQYRFVHIGALVMFGLALYKEILLIPNLIADEINNVHYQGGNLNTQIFYLVMLIIIVASSIAAAFIGFYKKEEEATADMPVNGLAKIVKVAVGGALVLAAVLTSSLISADMQRKMNLANANAGESFNPINEEIKKAANDYAYDFDPSNVLVKEQESYNFGSLPSGIPTPDHGKYTGWSGHNLVYYFEGAYAEGYQGDYSETYGYLALYEEGVFGGRINDTQIKGYWYNSSIAEGSKDGVDIKDCLKMVSNVNNYDQIIANDASGFYKYNAYCYLGFSWGTRSMGLGGYEYYPEVALAIDYSATGLDFQVGEVFDRDSWSALRILKNLSYSSVFKSSEVSWTIPSGMLDKDNVFQAAGEYEIKATWKNSMLNETHSASVKINVKEAPAE